MSSAPYYQSLPPQDDYSESPTAQQLLQQELGYTAHQDGQDLQQEPHRDEHGDGLTQAEREAQLAQLLEAVKAGGGQGDLQSDAMYHAVDHEGTQLAAGDTAATRVMSSRKRKRGDATTLAGQSTEPKRSRLSTGQEDFSNQHDPRDGEVQSATAPGRRAGVHSSVALFRNPPTSTAKKATRPPMAKLYSSLRISPENFLHLQAAAKTYMLDPKHPIRQDCVGVRGDKTVDMAKLRLFNCVNGFLEQGAGPMFFPDVSGDQQTRIDGAITEEEERWVWPRDAEQIISLVTPLMRRMVTNERQRVYAQETRKGGSGGGSFGVRKSRSEAESVEGEGPSDLLSFGHQHGCDLYQNDAPQDDSHTQHHSAPIPEAPSDIFNPSTAPADTNGVRKSVRDPAKHVMNASGSVTKARRPVQAAATPIPQCATNVLQFIFMRGKTRLLRFDWPDDPSAAPLHSHMTFDKLGTVIVEHVNKLKDPGELLRQELQQIDRVGTADVVADGSEGDGERAKAGGTKHWDELRDLGISVLALAVAGAKVVDSEKSWTAVKQDVVDTPWLEGCLRIVVEVT